MKAWQVFPQHTQSKSQQQGLIKDNKIYNQGEKKSGSYKFIILHIWITFIWILYLVKRIIEKHTPYKKLSVEKRFLE